MLPIGLLIIYGLLAVLVIATAIAMLTARNAIYAALYLVLNFATVAILYLTLGAPFIALAQISVYAGAIMVLFLFVIMLLGAEQLRGGPTPRKGHITLAIILSVVFLAEVALFVVVRATGMDLMAMETLSPDFASPARIGNLLFEQYLLPFEITAIILLSAVVGAIFLTRRERLIKGASAVPPENPIETPPIY
jgi:NADH-quinone oxidoreductase subunit J